MGALPRPVRYTEVLQCCLFFLFFIYIFLYIYIYISAFLTINPHLSSPPFLPLTQFPTPHSLSPYYICSLPRCYTITPVSFPWSSNLQSNFFFSLLLTFSHTSSLLSSLSTKAQIMSSLLLPLRFLLPPSVRAANTLPPSGFLSFHFFFFFFEVGDLKKKGVF